MGNGRFSSKIFPGARFGKLVVISRIPRTGTERSKVLCQCDCGNQSSPNADNLVKIKSCGCEKYSGAAKKRRYNVGDRFNRLTVIELHSGDRLNVTCRCDCGTVLKMRGDGLTSKNQTKSCGCLMREVNGKRISQANKDNAKFDGFSKENPDIYLTWQSMRNRCLNKNQLAYEVYGKIGVIICRYLRSDPRNLLECLGPKENESLTIDRHPIHDGNYTCGRCYECKRNGWSLNIRWATRKEQALNRGDFNVFITAFGQTLTKSQWMEKSGLSWSCLTGRLERGWSVEKSLTTPDKKGNCYKPVNV